MSKIRFGLIGSGWRAEFYIRIAKALPEMFDLAAVMIRSKEKGEAFSAKFGVKVVNTLDELVEKEPEFVVMAIKRGIVTENLITLFERGIPVLTETPPGEDVEALHIRNISQKCRWQNSISCSRSMHPGTRQSVMESLVR